jgi:YidC/Oxa1 family membrane protein insertase
MDTRRLILFFIFTFSLVMLWDAWQKQQARLNPPAQQTAAKAPAAGVPTPAVPLAVPGAAPATTAAVPGPVAAVPAVPGVAPAVAPSKALVRTDIFAAEITSEGGDLRYLEFLQHKSTLDKTKTFVMLGPQHNYFAQTGLLAAGVEMPTHKTLFALAGGTYELKPGENKLAVRMEAAMPVNGGAIKVAKIYTFTRGSYVIDIAYEITNGGSTPIVPSAYLQMVRDGKAPDGDSKFMQTFTGAAFFNEKENFHKQDFSDIEKGKTIPVKAAPDGWAGMIQHYFAVAWLPPKEGAGANWNGASREFYTKKVSENFYSAGMIIPAGTVAPGATLKFDARLFAGPQDQDMLAAIQPGLNLVVDYGWLTIIAQPMFELLKWLHKMLGNWGLAIIALTVIIKAAFFPLSAASYKSMARMKKVTPRLTALRERYGSDRMKMNQAMMELYKEEKINPLGGCLPIVIQIPVFIALYWTLLASVEMRHAPFYLWITDLSAPDTLFGTLPGLDMPVGLLPIIMAVSMFIQTKMNPTPPDPIQAKMMLIMPVVFSVFFFFFPAGLVLYWVVNNVLSIAQQWQITRMIESGADPDKKKKA